jgi:sec-independent protein translocase protein TatC
LKENDVTATQQITENDTIAPLSSHISELRSALLAGIVAWLCALTVVAFYYQPLLELTLEPYRQAVQATAATQPLYTTQAQILELHNISPDPVWQTITGHPLVMGDGVEKHAEKYMVPPGSFLLVSEKLTAQPQLLSPTEGFSAALRVCLWFSLLFSAPVWGIYLIRFISPALPPAPQRSLYIFSGIMYAAILLALFIAHTLTLPLTNSYLWSFNATLGNNAWHLERYIDYMLLMLIAHGSSAILITALFFSLHVGWLKVHWLASYRRHVLLGTFIFSALLTPPDIFSQVLLAIPLYILFEASLCYGYWRQREN